jgi:S-adenosylmethionine-diacylglycerol 3-amino-3-carboxypropyl transferase
MSDLSSKCNFSDMPPSQALLISPLAEKDIRDSMLETDVSIAGTDTNRESPNLPSTRERTADNLRTAVHRNKTLSKTGLLERTFTLAFRNLVYPQIWEDPVVDMEALAIKPGDHVVTIASGGCNVLSYLTANPQKITALDLNGAHIALNKLKLAALKQLPSHAAFYNFFGHANLRGNIAAYDKYIRPHLDESTRRYWDARSWRGKRRISMFARGFYRHGLLGTFIGAAHVVARMNGCNPKAILKAKTLEEQQRVFRQSFAPVFERRWVRWLVNQPASLYGLGIPPAQYTALAGNEPGGMAQVLRGRVEKLACGFNLHDNYFAWQAFGRGYENVPSASTPPYLEKQNFEALRASADKVEMRHQSMTTFLEESGPGSIDCVVLLDAQDWMGDADLTGLWTAITNAARPGARVIFRTAADERLLPGRIPQNLLDQWDYDGDRSRALHDRDRSSIYGMFHVYTLKGTVQ